MEQQRPKELLIIPLNEWYQFKLPQISVVNFHLFRIEILGDNTFPALELVIMLMGIGFVIRYGIKRIP